MLTPHRIGRYVILSFAALFLLSGCALVDYGFELFDGFLMDKEEKGAAELMSEGTVALENGRYEAATEAFQKVKDRYPYSRFAITAELKMADALFKQKEFDAAWEAYDEFERLHPKNREIPYVIFQKGDSHLAQVSTIDRDQTHTLKARDEFERLIRRFPRDEYSGRARKRVRKCLIFLSEYELYVGHYYYRMGKYRAAMGRYAYIIKHYPDMGQYHEAMEFLSRCKEKITIEEEEKREEEEEKKG